MLTETLNDRQKTYLLTVFRLDQAREADQRGAWNRGQRVQPAAEWRWIAYGTSESMLRLQLLEAHLVDEGTGSTFESLDYVELEYELDSHLIQKQGVSQRLV